MVVFSKFAHMLIAYINLFYAFINTQLTPFFDHSGLDEIIRKVILLVLIPVAIVAVPALSYRLVKGKEMPYLIEATWCLWLVITFSNILLRY